MSDMSIAAGTRRSRWGLFIAPILLLVLAIAWSGFWFYAASQAEVGALRHGCEVVLRVAKLQARGWVQTAAARRRGALGSFRVHLADRRPDLIRSFPKRALETGITASWRATAAAIYENWFDYLKGRKLERRSPALPRRRVWRDWPATAALHATGTS